MRINSYCRCLTRKILLWESSTNVCVISIPLSQISLQLKVLPCRNTFISLTVCRVSCRRCRVSSRRKHCWSPLPKAPMTNGQIDLSRRVLPRKKTPPSETEGYRVGVSSRRKRGSLLRCYPASKSSITYKPDRCITTSTPL